MKKHDERQLTFNFEQDPLFRKQVEDFARESLPQAKTVKDKEFLSSIERGQRNMFAGMFFHYVFLNQVDLPDAFNFDDPGNNNIYDSYEIIETIFFGLNIGLPSIESHKLVNSRDIGLLLGRNRSPDESTIRSRLKQMSEFNPSENLINHFADLFLKLGFINPEVFFIDGHFLPITVSVF